MGTLTFFLFIYGVHSVHTHILTHNTHILYSVHAFLPAGFVSDLSLWQSTALEHNSKNTKARKRRGGKRRCLSSTRLSEWWPVSQKMRRDREGLAKTNYTELMDTWEQGPGPGHTEAAMLAEKHTHKVTNTWYLYLLQSMTGWESHKGVRDVSDLPLIVAVLSSLWAKHKQSQIKIILSCLLKCLIHSKRGSNIIILLLLPYCIRKWVQSDS